MSQPVMPWYAEEGLPVATTSYIYSSFRTGEIKAIVGGADLVKYRTPAKSALAAKYLAPKKTSYTLGLIGLGVQAVTHTEAFSKLFNITKILGTSRHPEKWQKNIDEIELKTNLKLELTDIDKLVERSDIVVVITSATQPLVKFSMLHKGQLVIGTDHAETVAKDVALNAEKVFVDYRPTAENEPATIKMLLEEGHAYEEIVDGDLLQLTGGALPGRESEDEIIFFQSLGVLNENLAAVEYLYDKLKNEAEEIVF
jgi:ornithine cyclodeaminase